MGFRRTGFSPVFSLLIPTFSLAYNPPSLPRAASPRTQRSPTHHERSSILDPRFSINHARKRTQSKIPNPKSKSSQCLSFGSRLEPPYIIGARTHRPVRCYAVFKGWLLLSQPPGCQCTLTSFYTEPVFRGLSGRSGLFPSRQRSLSPAVSLQSSHVAAFGV